MKLARSPLHLVAGIVVLILILAAGAVMVDERLSKQLDNVDILYEEVFGGKSC